MSKDLDIKMNAPLFTMSKLETEEAFKNRFQNIKSDRALLFIFQLFVILDIYPVYTILNDRELIHWPSNYVIWGIGFLSTMFVMFNGKFLLLLLEYSLLSLLINKINRSFKQKLKSCDRDFEQLKREIQLLEDIDWGKMEPLPQSTIDRNMRDLKLRCIDLAHKGNITSLHQQTEEMKSLTEKNLSRRISKLPTVIAKVRTEQKLEDLKVMLGRAEEADLYFKNRPCMKFAKGYEDHGPEIRKHITQLEAILKQLTVAYNAVKTFEAGKTQHVSSQVDKAEKFGTELINNRFDLWSIDKYSSLEVWNDTIRSSWLAMTMGFSVSAAEDLFKGQQVYCALREVNNNFSDLSNTEIWLESVLMNDVSLQGLVSLAKGRYFENQVAENTDGQLFENFNHAGTDITIDGMEFQLKATDSEAYINSVDDDLLVIATSEVADKTSAIDSGISNEELTSAVEHALGGSVIDVGDGILGAVGFLGIFATVNGLNHFFERLEKKVEPCVAADEALEIALKQSLEGFASVGDLIYRVIISKPSRLLCRFFLWIFRIKPGAGK
jgi:hypothetical protein